MTRVGVVDVRRRQCAKCPWRKDVDPYDIPNGYSRDKHRALVDTVAAPGVLNGGALRIMACHESDVGKEMPCVGWLLNQLGSGNNIALRLAVIRGRVDANVDAVGEQYECLEDTVPRRRA